MKILKYFLSVAIFLNSAFAFSGPKEEAQKSIDQSHVAARQAAQVLLQEDLNQLTAAIMTRPEVNFPLSVAGIPQQIQKLNQKVLAQLNITSSAATMDLTQLKELVLSYEALVRERFQASFQVQDIIYGRQMGLRAFELPFEGFAAMCRSGRSKKDIIGEPGALPLIPPNQYAFEISYGGQASVSASAHSPNSNSKDRNTVGQVLGTSTGIATSIALSGGAGASVAMAMAVAPYLAAAFLAYSIVNFAVTNQEGIDLQNEATEGQVNLFHKAATDRDVARYYRESCEEVTRKLAPLYKTIHAFYESDQKRAELREEMMKSRPVREAYSAEGAAIVPYRKLLRLSFFIDNGQCEEVKSDSLCAKSGSVYTLKEDEAVKIDKDSNKDKERVDEAKAKYKAFTEKYPQEKALELQAHAVLEVMHEEWQAVSETLVNSSFDGVDSAMKLLAHKVRHFVMEVQKVQNSSWAKSTKLIATEEKLQREFFELRTEYFQLLTNGIKILFNKADANQGKARLKTFVKRFDSFARLTVVNPEVKAMNQAVQSLKGLYETL